MKVPFKNPRTGELKQIKVGFSWTLLLFSAFFGLPLFLRGLTGWGWAMLALSLGHPLVVALHPAFGISWADLGALHAILGTAQLACKIYLGFEGNRLTGRHLLREGWVPLDPDSLAAKEASARWRLAM